MGWVRRRWLCRRKRRLPYVVSGANELVSLAERQGVNFLIQSTASDHTSLSTVRIGQRLRDEGLQIPLVLTVHDELVYECPDAYVEKMSQIIKEETELKGFPKVKIPLKIDVGVSPAWGKLEKKVENGTEANAATA